MMSLLASKLATPNFCFSPLIFVLALVFESPKNISQILVNWLLLISGESGSPAKVEFCALIGVFVQLTHLNHPILMRWFIFVTLKEIKNIKLKSTTN